MTIVQKLSLFAIIGSAPISFAASVSKDVSKTIQPDNVIVCESNASCETKTLYGRSYKVINTPRFTVMVAISHEGNYTRADVSVANHTDTPLAMTPDDFRIEVVTPKPKVLLYVPHANLVLPLPAAAAPAAPAPPATVGHGFVAQSPAPAADAPAPPPEIDPAAEEKKKDNADKAATEQNLEATSIAPNQETRGRVYFERDKKAHLVNVVLPIAGLVFEFPYAMKK
jgi:hypothetical protein